MTAAASLVLATGMLLVLSWARARRFSLERRIAPRLPSSTQPASAPSTVAGRLVAPVVADIGAFAHRWGRPADQVARQLARAGSDITVTRHRVQGLVGGAIGLALGSAAAAFAAASRGAGPVPALLIAAAAGVMGAVVPDLLLARRAATRAGRLRGELPAVAEMLALAVVAGESVQAALDRVARLSVGPLGDELRLALAQVRAGRSVGDALDALADRTGEPVIETFCAAVVTAIERGTPLADVLHAQASDVRDRTRQTLIEDGGRREIAMLVPVVLLILPVTVVFALFPGLVALRLGG